MCSLSHSPTAPMHTAGMRKTNCQMRSATAYGAHRCCTVPNRVAQRRTGGTGGTGGTGCVASCRLHSVQRLQSKGSSDARSTAACCASIIAYCIVHIAHARGCDSSSMHRELQSGQPGFASRAAPHRCAAAVAAGGSLCALQRRAGKGRCMLCCTQAAIALRGFLGGPLVAASAYGTPAAERSHRK